MSSRNLLLIFNIAIIYKFIVDTKQVKCYNEGMNTKQKIEALRQKANDYEMMILLREQGWTLERIAEKFGVSKQHISKLVIGVKKNGKQAQK